MKYCVTKRLLCSPKLPGATKSSQMRGKCTLEASQDFCWMQSSNLVLKVISDLQNRLLLRETRIHWNWPKLVGSSWSPSSRRRIHWRPSLLNESCQELSAAATPAQEHYARWLSKDELFHPLRKPKTPRDVYLCTKGIRRFENHSITLEQWLHPWTWTSLSKSSLRADKKTGTVIAMSPVYNPIQNLSLKAAET